MTVVAQPTEASSDRHEMPVAELWREPDPACSKFRQKSKLIIFFIIIAPMLIQPSANMRM